MSAHVLLNLLNELGKRDKTRGLLSILSLFRNEFFERFFVKNYHGKVYACNFTKLTGKKK